MFFVYIFMILISFLGKCFVNPDKDNSLTKKLKVQTLQLSIVFVATKSNILISVKFCTFLKQNFVCFFSRNFENFLIIFRQPIIITIYEFVFYVIQRFKRFHLLYLSCGKVFGPLNQRSLPTFEAVFYKSRSRVKVVYTNKLIYGLKMLK